jgi:lipoprotein-releasing system ATP-binding protein
MILKAKGLKKSYESLPVLKGIDLSIEKGEIISIVGSSGAGKTTLLQILGTLDKPDSGELWVNQVNPFQLSEKKLSAFRNQHLGFIFQFHQLLPEFTAIENIAIPQLIKGIGMKEATRNAEQMLEIVGLKDRGKHKPNELSGGEQQRVSVCRAMINRPEIVFADEPSGNLDSKNATELHELFFNLRTEFKQTFIIVTHNDVLADMADRKLVMKDGLFV